MMNKTFQKRTFYVILLLCAAVLCVSCRKNEPIDPHQDEPVTPPVVGGEFQGLYLLNEGVMGSNKASLDYFDYTTGIYSHNIFPTRNPGVTKELGDVGNDIKIYGGKMYAVIYGSNLVEVMDARTATHITQVDIQSCRSLAFDNGKMYVTSYAGRVQPGNKQIGYVAEVDTATFQITRKCYVGFQPEEMAIVGGKMYVANSGGYIAPDYDNTLSIIDMNTFEEIKKVEVRINMRSVRVGSDGKLYITSLGNYADIPSDLLVFDPETETITKDYNIPASGVDIVGDSCYIFSCEYSIITGEQTIQYHLIDTRTQSVVSEQLIKDGTDAGIKVPYGIKVNPETRDFIVTDAADYVSPGTLYYFNANGTLKWKVITGDIPAKIAFY